MQTLAPEIGADCEVGPYCVIGAGVVLGDGCWLQHHVSLTGPSRFGKGNRFHAFTSIGGRTQDKTTINNSTAPVFLVEKTNGFIFRGPIGLVDFVSPLPVV